MIRQNGVPVIYTAPATHIRIQRFYHSTEQLQTTMLANEYQQLVFRQQMDNILRQAEIRRLEHENQMLELRQQAELQRLQHENRMREHRLEIARLNQNAESRRTVVEHRPISQDRGVHNIPRHQSREAEKFKASYDFKNQKASVEAGGDLAWFLTFGLLAFAGVAYSRK